MGSKLTLVDQGGNVIPRFGAAGVKRVLLNPVRATYDGDKDYALVWCEDAECYIARHGKGSQSCEFIVTSWDTSDPSCPPQELTFENGDRDKAIALFLKLCKRNPLYGDAPSRHKDTIHEDTSS